jgi:signal transduction histidine kinase/CheY-like chemotaxis protein/tetratricopeptide (TPR) repeat protein
MFRNCIIAVLLLLSGRLLAQNQYFLDSLEIAVKSTQSDSAQVSILNQLAGQYIRYGMPQAEEKLKESLRLTQDYIPERWTSQQSYSHARGRVCFLHGNYHKRRGNFPEAIRFYHESREKGAEIGNFGMEGNALIGIGTVYSGYLNEPENATQYFQQAEKAFQKANDIEGLMMVYGNMGAIYSNTGNLRAGLAETFKAEKIIRTNGLIDFEAQVLSTISAIYSEMDSIPQALEYAEKARLIFLRDKDLMRYGDHLLYMSTIFIKNNDDVGAEKYALEAVETGLQGQHKVIVQDAYLTLQDIYLNRAKTTIVPALKDSFFLKAFYFNGLNRVYKDSLFDTEKSRQIAELRVKFETEKKEHDISLLNAEAKDREIEILRKEVALRQATIQAEREREKALLLEQRNANIGLQLEVQDAKIAGQNTIAREKQREIEALNAINQRKTIEAESEKKLRYALLAGLLGLIFIAFLLLRLYLLRTRASQKIEQQGAEIETQNIRLAEANRFKSVFLSNMSHEIRTPLNTIIGMSELMASAKLPEKEQEYAKIVNQASKNLLTLINEILDFSKIEAGKIEFQPKPFDLHELLRQQIDLLRFPAGQKNLQLTLHCSDRLPQGIISDPGRLSQILLNLLSNAVKFTEQGSVTLHADVEHGSPGNQVMLKFSVLDTGIGISKAELPMVFEAFKQAGENTHLQHGGTGLGLAISKQLVELQGGRMEAQSSPGKGSEFVVYLPVERTELPEQTAAAKLLEKLNSLKILLVEDNQFNQLLATELFQQLIETPQITIAGNGFEALEKAAANTFDLVFMDIKMPKMDGFAATKALRATGFNTPIIALTANATAEERENCLQSGLDDYLSKPIEVNLLRDVIVKWSK